MPTIVYDACALGVAVLNVVLDVPEDFLTKHEIPKGAVTVIDLERINTLRKTFNSVRSMWAGDGAVNMISAFASLGGKSAYLGKITSDEPGNAFSNDLRKSNVYTPVEPLPQRENPGTSIRITFLTPDGQASTCYYPGSGAEMGPEDLNLDVLRNSQVTYVDGAMLDYPRTRDAMFFAVEKASLARSKVVLGLGDPEQIDRNREYYLQLVRTKIDMVFGHFKEVMAVYKAATPAEAISQLRSHVNTGVITRGEKGAVIVNITQRQLEVKAEPVITVVEKYGAGDAFAAGFLYAIVRQFDLASCGRLGAVAASEAISHFGPRPGHMLSILGKEKGILKS
jgi:sugar/nucleoside kinase (ribokinase family)